MKALWKIRALAIGLIVIFGLGTIFAVRALFTIGGVGLIKLKRWSWWLTIGLCAVSIIQLLWQLFTTLTPESATKQNEAVSYVVAGFYLAIAFLLTSDSVRKTFRERHGQDA